MSVKYFVGSSVLGEAAQAVQGVLGSLPGIGNWRWGPMNQWHVTALFIGHRPDDQISLLKRSISMVSRQHGPITLVEGTLLAMPETGPSMLWVRFLPSEQLTALHHALALASDARPAPYEPYWPHITLARGKGELTLPMKRVLLPAFTMDHLTLFRSDPDQGSTVHTPLESWRLTGSPT